MQYTHNTRARLTLAALLTLTGCGEPQEAARPTQTSKPALTVEATHPAPQRWPTVLAASGDIAAWQEAVIAPEIGNDRLVEVTANVGDRVQKGAILARLDTAALTADVAQARAAVAEAEAALTEARANAERANRLLAEGFYSRQSNIQYQTGEQTAQARVQAAQARLQSAQLRLDQAYIRAPDAGVISARNASVGSLAVPGQELFRLIRGGRLEWRARVAEADLGRLAPGLVATITLPDGARLQGKVRALAPSIDPRTREGLVYVDLAQTAGQGLRAGMFGRGEFRLGESAALTLPQSAVLTRDGFSYVFRIETQAGQGKVWQARVETGRRRADRVEIVQGLTADVPVVTAGVGFLADGDTVRFIEGPLSPADATPTAAAPAAR